MSYGQPTQGGAMPRNPSVGGGYPGVQPRPAQPAVGYGQPAQPTGAIGAAPQQGQPLGAMNSAANNVYRPRTAPQMGVRR